MCQSTTMSEPLPKGSLDKTELTKSTSSAAASPAKMCHAPALEKALKIAMGKLLDPDCGVNMQDSLASLDQNSCWRKMFGAYYQPLLISNQEATSELFSGTWPTWGMMHNGIVTELKPLAHRTKEKESLSWRTPKHALNLLDQVKHEGNWPTPTVADTFTGNLKSTQQKPGSMHSVNLSQCVNWSTPQAGDYRSGDDVNSARMKRKLEQGRTIDLNDVVKSWPTPTANDWKDTGDLQKLADDTHQARVGKMVARVEVKENNGMQGQLNADWVEILMGLPIGWTDVNKGNEDLEAWPGWPAPMNATQNWATPNTMDMLPSRSFEAMKHQATNGARKNRKLPGNLREQIDPLMRKAYIEASQENGGCLNEEVTVSGQYPYEPPRVVVGQKNRAKRLKCLGNGCVPAQIYPIFKTIMEIERVSR